MNELRAKLAIGKGNTYRNNMYILSLSLTERDTNIYISILFFTFYQSPQHYGIIEGITRGVVKISIHILSFPQPFFYLPCFGLQVLRVIAATVARLGTVIAQVNKIGVMFYFRCFAFRQILHNKCGIILLQ